MQSLRLRRTRHKQHHVRTSARVKPMHSIGASTLAIEWRGHTGDGRNGVERIRRAFPPPALRYRLGQRACGTHVIRGSAVRRDWLATRGRSSNRRRSEAQSEKTHAPDDEARANYHKLLGAAIGVRVCKAHRKRAVLASTGTNGGGNSSGIAKRISCARSRDAAVPRLRTDAAHRWFRAGWWRARERRDARAKP